MSNEIKTTKQAFALSDSKILELILDVTFVNGIWDGVQKYFLLKVPSPAIQNPGAFHYPAFVEIRLEWYEALVFVEVFPDIKKAILKHG